MPEGSNGLSYALGFVAATAFLHAMGLLGALTLTSRAFARVASAVVALVGAAVSLGWV